ncbi:TnsD family transposase [Priestia sp. GS2]|uniref:TnsD family transposase n=1 Tax=Priestia sp. GS2 TaxID=3117403 RepID=UPI002ED7DB28
MLPFFTNPYPDELIYSAISRYHFYNGNHDCKDTLEEMFGNRSVIPSLEIGSHFSVLAQKLGSHYSIKDLLANHTIYPYYDMFLSNLRQQEILRDVVGDGKGLYTRLGMVAGSICRKNDMYYCAECAKTDIDRYGELYIHREHQLQGVVYCPHHELPLKKYPITPNVTSRIKFIRFEIGKIDLTYKYEVDPHAEINIYLAKQAYKLLQQPLQTLTLQDVTMKYRGLLRNLNLVTTSNRIRQKELYERFEQKLPSAFLERFESVLDVTDEYNWLKMITRNIKRHVHPFRHLLMLYVLEKDVDDFIGLKADRGPFGKGPFPCLNRAAVHYKKSVIPIVKVTRDFKTNAPIGTFTCSCGFIYARKGPDQSVKDQFHIGRIKQFGHVWHEKLKRLSKGGVSIRTIARELGVDFKTIKRKLSEGVEISKKEQVVNQALMEEYKQNISDIMNQFPHLSRSSLREKCKKQYIFLYRHDKDWLMNKLPFNKNKLEPTKVVDWVKRDKEYAANIIKQHCELLELEKPIRITMSLIGKRLGILAKLERHLDELPRTKKLLLEITEPVQQFQIRRCCIVIDNMWLEDQPLQLWKVQRIAAVKSHHFHEIKPQLESYIKRKQDVTNDERTTS